MKEDKKKSVNVPNLRFPGFKGEWKEEKLGEGCDVLMCKRIFAHQTTEEGHIPFYKIGTIGDVPDAFISKELFDEYKNKYKYPRKGEVLITCAGTVGKCLVFDGIDSYFQDSNIVWISNPKLLIENSFLYYFVSNVDWSMLNSTTITRLYNDDLRNLKIKFPDNLQEQKKIADFLFIIDQRIQTQIKIIEKYKSLIKVLNEAIFSQKIRFHNSEGEWTTYRVSDFLEFFSTNSLSWEQLEYDTDNLYNLHYGLIHQCESSQINLTEHTLPNIKAEFIPKNYSLCLDGDIAFADASEDTNDVAKSVEFLNCRNNKVVSGLHTIHGRDKLNITIPGFKGYAFSSKLFHHQVRRLAQGTKVFSISPKTFDNIYVDIPSKEEQSKIANFFSFIEQKIAKEKQLLDNYNVQKRYLLKNMFI